MKLRPLNNVKEDYEWKYRERYAVVSDNSYILAMFCSLQDARSFIAFIEEMYINTTYDVMQVIEE